MSLKFSSILPTFSHWKKIVFSVVFETYGFLGFELIKYSGTGSLFTYTHTHKYVILQK